MEEKMGKLDGKVAIMTGAGAGIGKATALLYAKEGAKVVVACRTASSGEETVSMIRKAGGEACFVKTDVAIADDVKKMIKVTLDNYGRLDILNNNAGIVEKQAPTHEVEEADWDRVISIDLKGTFLTMKFAIPEMLKRGGGVIINAASVFGLVGFPGLPAYSAAKGGVVQLTKAAALEYATRNIRVNCLCCSVIWTELMESSAMETAASVEEAKKRSVEFFAPIGRVGTPEDVAQAALFLACDDSSFMTGVAFPLDGGFLASPHRFYL